MLSTDPIDIELGVVTHDLPDDLNFVWTSGIAGVTQGIKIAISMFKGEVFSDLDEGVPYLAREGVPTSEALLGQRFNAVRARAAFRKVILKVPGVGQIVTLEPTFDSATRRLTVRWVVTTSFGDTVADTLTVSV